MKIALVIGHAKNKQGAWGNKGISEYKYYKKYFIPEILKHLPGKHEYKIFERPTDRKGYGSRMKKLHAEIDKWGADVSVSFHFNAAGSTKANGHEVLYCSKRGKKLAKKMNNLFSKYIGKVIKSKDRGIVHRSRKERGGGFLCRGKSVCILVEPYFAAHQDKFMPGTEGFEAFQKAVIEFFKSI